MLIQWVPLSSHFNTGCIAKTNTWFGGKKKHSIWIICMAESIANYDPGGNGEKNTLRCTLSISKVSSTEAGAPFRIGIHWKYCSFYESDEASRFRAPWNVSLDADCSIRSNWRRSILRLFVCFFFALPVFLEDSSEALIDRVCVEKISQGRRFFSLISLCFASKRWKSKDSIGADFRFIVPFD